MAEERGCGVREKGGVYLETKLHKEGVPIESFLLDPPVEVDPEAMGITPVGVKVIEAGTMTHVIDWVGKTSYPNVADFVEEAKVRGVSRRIAKTTDVSRLGPNSRLILVHERGSTVQMANYVWAAESRGGLHCPTGKHEPNTTSAVCCGFWWHDVEGGVGVPYDEGPVMRETPSVRYAAFKPPQAVEFGRRLAMFMSIPIDQITVIDDPESGTTSGTVASLSATGLPVVVEKE